MKCPKCGADLDSDTKQTIVLAPEIDQCPNCGKLLWQEDLLEPAFEEDKDETPV